jgi:DUF1365 family protein
MILENNLYVGEVRHRRFTPRLHQFTYNIFMFCFDISKITEALHGTHWYSFKRTNYFGAPGEQLDYSVRQHIKEKNGIAPSGKIFLLTHLSTLGYCFNPISVYIVFKPDSNEIEMLLTEVTNTPWGERHIYILDAPRAVKNNVYQYVFEKVLHVSPFMQMNYEYHLNFKIDNNKLILHMDSYKNSEHHFDATLSLDGLQLNKENINKMKWRYPFITYKVTAAIYWEALKLFIKRVPFYAHPKS